MTHYAQLSLGDTCARVPMLAWSAAPCTDYSDSLNFSLTNLRSICCGIHQSISRSVRLPLIHAWHRIAANGMSCASVRALTAKCAPLAFIQLCCGQLLISSAFTNFKEYIND